MILLASARLAVANTTLEYTPPPKRPATPFFLYLADHRPAKTNATEILAFTRERAKKWHELSQTERQV